MPSQNLFEIIARDGWQIQLQPEFAQGGVIIGPSSQWPMVLTLGFFDWKIVDAGNASAHQPLLIKFQFSLP